MRIELITPPAVEPLTVAEAKLYARVDHTDEDTLFTELVAQAREYAEAHTGRSFGGQTRRLVLPCFPRSNLLPLPRPPLASVTSVKYLDGDQVEQTLVEDTDYVVITDALPGAVYAEGGWPETYQGTRSINPALDGRSDVVRIEYTCGHGAAGVEALPSGALLLMKYLVAHWYERREAVNYRFASAAEPMPFAVGALIGQLRVAYRLPA